LFSQESDGKQTGAWDGSDDELFVISILVLLRDILIFSHTIAGISLGQSRNKLFAFSICKVKSRISRAVLTISSEMTKVWE
jgi:hypothetical protein